MKSNGIGRYPLRRFVIVAALFYGILIGWSVVPSVAGIVVPKTLREIRRNTVYSVSVRNSADRDCPQLHSFSKRLATVARLWNDFQ